MINWKPRAWFAVLLGIVAPPFTFLYVNKAKLFWLYFVAINTVACIDWYFDAYFTLLFSLICPVHAGLIISSFDENQERHWFSRWWVGPAILVNMYLAIFLVRSYVIEPFSVPASSMSPSVNESDYIVIKKLGFGRKGTFGITLSESHKPDDVQLERGKVYVFYPPHDNERAYFKRLIGLPGDVIEFNEGKLSVNNQEVPQEFIEEVDGFKIFEESLDENRYLVKRRVYGSPMPSSIYAVPPDSYFFVGDNRDMSSDSRVWGPVPSQRFVGETIYVLKLKNILP